jgi:hypothetical protein
VAEPQEDGLNALRERLQRRPRTIPPSRHPRPDDPPAGDETQAGPSPAPPTTSAREPSRRFRPQPASEAGAPDAHPATTPGEPLANLAIRPRRSLDNRLGDLVHALRREGIRTSKVELVELLLWELPAGPTSQLRARLASFRQQAPREPLP